MLFRTYFCVCRRIQFLHQFFPTPMPLFIHAERPAALCTKSVLEPSLLTLFLRKDPGLICFLSSLRMGLLWTGMSFSLGIVATACKQKPEGLHSGKKSELAAIQKTAKHLQEEFTTDALKYIGYLLDGLLS